MQETSPTAYSEVGSKVATDAIEANPKEWLQFIADKNPDLLAQVATGRDDITKDRLDAEMRVLLDEDDEDVQAAMEAAKQAKEAEATKVETPEQKQIREWQQEREQQKRTEITSRVFEPIYLAVDDIVSQAGYEIKESDVAAGTPFAELSEENQDKVMLNAFIPHWVDMRVKMDPSLMNVQARIEGFIAKGDEQSALNLQHIAKIAVTNFANEVVSTWTGRRTRQKQAETRSPALTTPPAQVKSGTTANDLAPAIAANGNKGMPTEDDWKVTEADLNRG
jgi:hypothetical protein